MSTSAIVQINIEVMLFILCVSIWILTRVWNKRNRNPFYYIWVIDLLTAGLLLSDVLAIAFRGNSTVTGFIMVRAANFSNFVFVYGIPLFFSFFVDHLLDHPRKGRLRILLAKIVASLALLLNCVNLFVPFVYSFDERNRYFRMSGWYVNACCLLIGIFLLATVVVQQRKALEAGVFWMILIDILMPLIATVVQLFIYGFSITNIAIGTTQLILFLILYRDQEMRIRERDIQISEYNARLMLTQVQPHFLLNTLSTIQYLCTTDSKAAAETISDLGIYLRNNMEFASSTERITFEKELSHIEKYMAIERMRFGDRIRIVYDIKEKNFELPPLSIQPLIENAIKHGISKKRKGGTIELSTWRAEEKIHVLVKDDGVGFDPSKPFTEDRVHIGLSIVKERLRSMCQGEVTILSQPGQGTTCEIVIPIEF